MAGVSLTERAISPTNQNLKHKNQIQTTFLAILGGEVMFFAHAKNDVTRLARK
ncbi:MAG: hypothetical protein IKJ35_03280 [Clostridia bacterium]|nr:hypothetical protein [Clostridia bacterium]